MPRKAAKDSITGKIEAEKRHEITYPVPEGLAKLSAPEQTAWDQWIAAKDDWKDAELRVLHKLVKEEGRLVDLQCEQRLSPSVYEKASGDLAPHPIHGIVDACQKAILAHVRALGLNNTPGTTAGGSRAKPESAGRGKKAPALSLLR